MAQHDVYAWAAISLDTPCVRYCRAIDDVIGNERRDAGSRLRRYVYALQRTDDRVVRDVVSGENRVVQVDAGVRARNHVIGNDRLAATDDLNAYAVPGEQRRKYLRLAIRHHHTPKRVVEADVVDEDHWTATPCLQAVRGSAY